ncbi:DUF456 domain-containing protein [Halostella salina]|uniref:DUF456 domain-containing protein n=1 Tax=Halostella salina TaxID=1547897 RepID=UPI000EF7E812|nr:DUF456 domain-containing protein [Halostella salina]
MVETVTLLAVALLVAGVVGSVVPLVPGALLSTGAVVLHWWYLDVPSGLTLAALVAVGALAVAVDYFAGAISAKAGGASWLASVAAGVVGVVALLATGPLGALVAVALTVFLVEAYRGRSRTAGARAALFATVGMLGSAVAQVLLTATMLVAFVLVVFL